MIGWVLGSKIILVAHVACCASVMGGGQWLRSAGGCWSGGRRRTGTASGRTAGKLVARSTRRIGTTSVIVWVLGTDVVRVTRIAGGSSFVTHWQYFGRGNRA